MMSAIAGSPIDAIGHVAGVGRVLALRARILEQSQSLGRIAGTTGSRELQPVAAPAGLSAPAAAAGPAGAEFARAMDQALQSVNQLQTEGSAASAAWERGDTQDIASVMLARQKASIAFEATLQSRNRLLSAYRDIMNMPV